jgi:hypothetical protein
VNCLWSWRTHSTFARYPWSFSGDLRRYQRERVLAHPQSAASIHRSEVPIGQHRMVADVPEQPGGCSGATFPVAEERCILKIQRSPTAAVPDCLEVSGQTKEAVNLECEEPAVSAVFASESDHCNSLSIELGNGGLHQLAFVTNIRMACGGRKFAGGISASAACPARRPIEYLYQLMSPQSGQAMRAEASICRSVSAKRSIPSVKFISLGSNLGRPG